MNDLNLITVSELGLYAPEINTSKYTQETISGMISMASKQVGDYLGYTPLAEDLVLQVSANVTTEGDLLIFPPKIPVQSVTAISLQKGSQTINVGLTNGANNRYNVDYTKRNIRIPYSEVFLTGTAVFVNFYELRGRTFYANLTYRGGFEASQLPQTIKLATLMYMRDILANPMNVAGATRYSQGNISFDFDTENKSKFVSQAEKLLGPYRQI